MMTIRNILCDRDGTIIVDKHYLSNPCEVELLPTVQEGILLARQHKYFLALISNQSGVGRGYFSKEDVEQCNRAMCSHINAEEDSFHAMLYCPHSPEEACSCRKPALGMWHTLQASHHLQADSSVMIGDKKEDIEFAINAHFPYAFLVATGKGRDCMHLLGITDTNSIHLQDITEVFTHHYAIDTHYTTIYAVTSFIDAIHHIMML